MTTRVAGVKLSLLIGTAAIVLGVFAVEVYADRQGFSYKEIIVGLGAAIVGIIVFGRERGIRFGLVLWVLTLALGYRTIQWTENLRIHPSEILVWLLFVCVCVQRQFHSATRFSLPWWLWLMAPFWVLGWWPLIVGDAPWDKMFNEFRDFLLLIPLMITASAVLEKQSYWRYLLVAFFAASSWIALMGVTEYWFPGVERIFPAFIHAAKPELTAEGFVRAQFSFWGGAQATFICVLALPGAIFLASWWRGWMPRLAIVLASVVQIMAIYIGGYRSIWLVLLIQVAAAFIFRVKKYGVVVAVLVFLVAIGGYQFIPNTNERVITGISALQGNPIDHSAQDRKERALDALDDAIESPFGNGWSSAGWVHSDFLQVAANLGILAGLIFLGGYLFTLTRMARQMPVWLEVSARGDLGLSLLLSFVGAGGLLAMQGVQVLPQMALPVWFVWALVDIWLRQTSEARDVSYSYAPPDLYPAANFQ
ncbi:MAG TPA: hypothetical protein VK208_10890 [Pyrinomonadaceae bacterium]|jgi:hypothetical protein|nr:hypothetical protein [Pyrinomonadaceae bacterium]